MLALIIVESSLAVISKVMEAAVSPQSSGLGIISATVMKIGLISDTHIPRDVASLPAESLEALRGVDLILHAGDIYVASVLDELERVAPVLAARGNGDTGLPQDPRVRDVHVLSLDGLTVGLVHGLAYPYLPIEATFGTAVDVVVYGHTHVEAIEREGHVLLVNPGSPTLPSNLVGVPGTVGLLEIAGGHAHARIVHLSGGRSGRP